MGYEWNLDTFHWKHEGEPTCRCAGWLYAGAVTLSGLAQLGSGVSHPHFWRASHRLIIVAAPRPVCGVSQFSHNSSHIYVNVIDEQRESESLQLMQLQAVKGQDARSIEYCHRREESIQLTMPDTLHKQPSVACNKVNQLCQYNSYHISA